MKVLIGSITYRDKDYILDRWFARLQDIIKLTKFHIDQVDLLIIDNTNDIGEHAEYLRNKLNCNVIKERYMEETNANIANSRNRLRKEVLFEGYDYLFMLESDVLPPREIIIELLNHKVPVVSGWYHVGQGLRWKRPCVVMPFRPIEEAKKLPENHVEISLAKERLVRVLQGSMGCCLIRQDVLRKLDFFHLKSRNTAIVHDDTFFFVECEMKGVPVYVDSDMLCLHFQSNWWKEYVLNKIEKDKLLRESGGSENQIIIKNEVN